MKIKKLYLKNFRNYEEEVFSFCDDINVIYGKNGQGKTNVLEALYFFVNGRSYRASKEKEVIKKDKEKLEVKISFESNGRDMVSEIEIKENKIIKVNGIGIGKLSELVGFLKAIMFTPDMLGLIKDGPSKRRNFVDNFLSLIYPVYFKSLISYYKVLKQKNNALKQKNADKDMISIWNSSLAKYGSIVCRYRKQMVEKLNPYAGMYQSDMSTQGEKLEIKYNPSVKEKCDDEQYFLSVLEKNKDREIELGFSLIGPHRDDFDFYINGMEMKLYSSQGQIRTAILSLILSESDIICDMFGEHPIILLDDIMSELDEERRKYLLSKIKDKQVIITCTDKEDFKSDKVKFFHIQNGKIV